MMQTLALIGAGGKMGCRITDNLVKGSNRVYYVEISERGIKNLADRGIIPTPHAEAIPNADVIILAVPDVAIGNVSAGVVPGMRPGAILMVLDPATAYFGKLPERGDITYFVAHPRRTSSAG
jgi:3-hydroxyisobutyrate dehydrogenase-like beta-hydroxyacid dehydrogenase